MAYHTAAADATFTPRWHCTQDGGMSIEIDTRIYVHGARAEIAVWAAQIIHEAARGEEGD